MLEEKRDSICHSSVTQLCEVTLNGEGGGGIALITVSLISQCWVVRDESWKRDAGPAERQHGRSSLCFLLAWC